ncbi:MAG: hypothetical protein AAF657_20430 [Acidobacteriota bacterium]
MHRTVKQSLICLSLALVILPLTHRKPGLPATLKADEAAYYLTALSLARDGDLRCETKDLLRLYQEYPYTSVQNLILSTDDGWRKVYFGKPYIYSLLAAPFAALWKANGLVAFNTLLMVAMLWMSVLYLRRFNPDWLAALFSVGFFLLSTTYRYVYWLQPELLNMFATAGCLFFGLHVARLGEHGRQGGAPNGRAAAWIARLSSDHAAMAWSAGILALGVYNKPMLALMGLPVCWRLLYGRHWRALAVWLLTAILVTGALAGFSMIMTGHPTAYLGVDRQGFTIDSPHAMPMEPKELPEDPAVPQPELGRETAGWWWIFRVPQLSLTELAEDSFYFFLGRHTGLFLYHPFALIALGLFVVWARDSSVRWVVFASLAALALFNLVFLNHNWHGGGGFVGNRYFLMAYPAFIYLVTRIRPPSLVVAGFASGSLFVGSLLLSPFSLAVPSPTLQAHVRHPPFQIFPIEHSLVELPGYLGKVFDGLYVRGRKDHLRVEGEDLWIAGGGPAELWLQQIEPLDELVLEVRSPIPDNEVVLQLEDAEVTVIAGPEPQRVVLRPTRPREVRKDRNRSDFETLLTINVYRMEVRGARAELPRWRNAGEQFFYRSCILRVVDDSEAGD